MASLRLLAAAPLLSVAALLGTASLLGACQSEPAPASPDAALRAVEGTPPPDAALAARVLARVAEVDSLRIARAATIPPGADVTAETFAEVCQPVGRRIREVAETEGWEFRQVAVRNRNPANAASAEDARLHARFEAEPALQGLWLEADRDGQRGHRYVQRITMQATCAACHGARDERPDFVLERYPEDRAYGFATGGLRGLYSVFVPASVFAPASLAGE
ncbi:MAG: DUF3365 domain-containing protein [Rubricoccaceae bacterium]